MNEVLVPDWRDDWALFLDVDGTLLEIAATPASVRVPRRLIDVLAGVSAKLGGALALVSGRALADVDSLFAPLRVPAAGAHGAERRTASGNVLRQDDSVALAPAKRLLAAWAAAHAGVLLEDKGSALALHYRLAPELEAGARQVAGAALSAAGPRFQLQDGKKVLEIRATAVNKGQAIEAFMREPPFAGRVPVFLGDDVTDEDGFAFVNRFGGHSIRVGLDRATRARWRLADEAQAVRWLESHLAGDGHDG
jgi:trehalose 6-phosphate phosphatase